MTNHCVVAALVRRCLVVSTAAAMFASAPASADLIIDDFSFVGAPDPWAIVLSSVSTKAVAESGLKGVLGSVRETELEASLVQVPGKDGVVAAIKDGIFHYTSSIGAAGNVSLLYTGRNNITDSLAGQTGIAIDFLSLDFADEQPLKVTVVLSDGLHAVSHSQSMSKFTPTLLMEFVDFKDIAAVNLFSIASLRVDFLAPQGVEFQLEQIHAIPAASTTALLGAAVLIAGPSLRRRSGDGSRLSPFRTTAAG